MKKLRNFMIIFVIIVGVILIGGAFVFNHYTKSMGIDEKVEVTIDSGTSPSKIGKILYDNGLIRSETFYKLYLKLFNVNNLKAGKYELNKNMSLEEILSKLKEGNNYNEDEISLTFREGINMRSIAKVIANGTDNTEQAVFDLLKKEDYLKGLINDYWFITEDILNKDIYYSLEGYLYPDTYRFNNKQVTVEEIFNKLIKKMDSVLTPLKEKIEKSRFNTHEILTLASIAELESKDREDYREKIVSVFANRLDKKMSLGSDITTRYSVKLDDKRALKKSEYATVNAYNTRSETMAGKLPAGPIAMPSSSSILAVLNYPETDYLYFIANIQTGETFFYSKYSDFEKKKQELSKVNGNY